MWGKLKKYSREIQMILEQYETDTWNGHLKNSTANYGKFCV